MPKRELMVHPAFGQRFTLEELAAATGLHPTLVEQFVEYGLLEQFSVEQQAVWFDVSAVCRLRTIRRLREDLGINLPGVAVVLDLLERIKSLQCEVRDTRGRQR